MAQQQDLGPSYWDVERVLADLHGTWRRHARTVLVASTNPYNGSVVWSCQVLTFIVEDRKEKAYLGASCAFRGKTGAKTLPAAMLRCLTEIWDKLEDQERSAAEQQAF